MVQPTTAGEIVGTQRELMGKVALITGAGRGIGLAAAREVARRGAGLILLDRALTPEAEALIDEVCEAGRPAFAEQVDLADAEGASRVVTELVSQVNSIDILVNNAGWIQVRPFTEISLDEWRRHIDINLTSMFVVTQAVVPGMIARG